MVYSTSNPPALETQAIAGPRKWRYTSADPIATVNTAGYITNGVALGMKVGDTVEVRDTATPTTNLCTVISAAANGSVDISDGTPIAQTNSD
jgi:hypothetical protein